MSNPTENPKKNSAPKRLNLNEFIALKAKRLKEDYRMPLLVKLFIALPIFILILILYFGLFYIPQLTANPQSSTKGNASNSGKQ